MIPLIFAVRIMVFPGWSPASRKARTPSGSGDRRANPALAEPNTLFNNIIYFFMVVGFTFFYTMVVFARSSRIPESLQRQGAFIPGVGRAATPVYLQKVLSRITIVGAVFLASWRCSRTRRADSGGRTRSS